MIRLKIDNKTVEAREGTPVIVAAREAGADIPSMCFREGKHHITSCMVCLVRNNDTGRLFPSCSIKVEAGMDIVTRDDEILEARKTALELLLSEHVGDCEAPCQVTCPAHMDIPLMNRLLAEGKFREALQVVRKDISLPAVLGRICSAPCEGACRRKQVDQAVSICLLKRFSGDHDLESDDPYLPKKEEEKGKSVSIIGAGAAGLAAAYYLQLRGYSCRIFDRNESPGGSLRREVESGKLPREVLELETGLIRQLGVTFQMKMEVDHTMFEDIQKSSDALVIATGMGESGVGDWGLEMSSKGILADERNFRVGTTKIFVTGSALKPSRMAIRALGQGKEAAFSVNQYLKGVEVRGEHFRFNSRFGKLLAEEADEYLKESGPGERIEPDQLSEGLTADQVMREAGRCLHCDCRDLEHCLLREFADSYGAQQKRFQGDDRNKVVKHMQHELVVYEPSKCIKCGICVEICGEQREELGFTYIGRGFDVEIGVPFHGSVRDGLKKVAVEAARACPTGALAMKKQTQNT